MASERLASRRGGRRRYSDELKAEVMAECDAPGASVAQVAMSHGMNANVVHRWRQWAREGRPPVGAARREFVPVTLTTAAMAHSTAGGNDIRVEIRRGATAITVCWPLPAAAECAAWLGDWLK
jgi:transposase